VASVQNVNTKQNTNFEFHLLISAPLTFYNTFFKIINGVVVAMDSSTTEKVHYLEDWRSQLE